MLRPALMNTSAALFFDHRIVDRQVDADPFAALLDDEQVDLAVELVEGDFDAGFDAEAGEVGMAPGQPADGFVALRDIGSARTPPRTL